MNFITKLKSYILAHKIVSTIIIAVILFGGYKTFFAKTTTAQTQYVLGTVSKGLVISTISASGQVSATNQVDIKAKVNGDITWVGVKAGQKVYAGQALATIDNTTAKQAVVDAQASLDASKLQFQKDQAQAPIDFQKANDTLTTDKENLANEYNTTFNDLSNTYLDLPNVITTAEGTLYGFDFSTNKTQDNNDYLLNVFSGDSLAKVKPFSDAALSDYATARAKYDPAILAYKQTNRASDPAVIEALLDQSIDTTTALAQSLQSELNFLATVTDTATLYNIHIPSGVATMQTTLRSDLTTANSDLSTLLAEKKSLSSSKQAITADQQNITLLQVGNPNGANPISLQISQNGITKQEEDLANLKTTLADYTVVAPFAGTLAVVDALVGQPAATVATIITNQQIAQLSLNEVDAAKVAVGDKATLTFDAVDGLSLTGTVEEIDSVGTVSQGVVSYTVKITFDTQDARIKPGMTVNASIQTAAHPDVLYVPSSAVKTLNGASYVMAFTPAIPQATVDAAGINGITSATAPSQIPVEVGISSDTDVEITSGLTEGEQIVIRTTTTAAAKTTAAASATSLLGGARTGGAGATGAVRVTGGNATFGR